MGSTAEHHLRWLRTNIYHPLNGVQILKYSSGTKDLLSVLWTCVCTCKLIFYPSHFTSTHFLLFLVKVQERDRLLLNGWVILWVKRFQIEGRVAAAFSAEYGDAVEFVSDRFCCCAAMVQSGGYRGVRSSILPSVNVIYWCSFPDGHKNRYSFLYWTLKHWLLENVIYCSIALKTQKSKLVSVLQDQDQKKEMQILTKK